MIEVCMAGEMTPRQIGAMIGWAVGAAALITLTVVAATRVRRARRAAQRGLLRPLWVCLAMAYGAGTLGNWVVVPAIESGWNAHHVITSAHDCLTAALSWTVLINTLCAEAVSLICTLLLFIALTRCTPSPTHHGNT